MAWRVNMMVVIGCRFVSCVMKKKGRVKIRKRTPSIRRHVKTDFLPTGRSIFPDTEHLVLVDNK